MQAEANKIKKVGILRGGAGKENKDYADSLKAGGDVILFLHENLADKYKPVDILVDQDYLWHVNGLPVVASDLVNKIDVAWNFSHPSMSNILESLSIPYVATNSFHASLEKSRDMLRAHMKNIGVDMPRQIAYPKTAREVFEKFGAPWIVKNSDEVMLAKTFNELAEAMYGRDDVIVEEFITGKVAALHTVPNFRGEGVYAFPVKNIFGDFSSEEKNKLVDLAKYLHNHIGAKHYLKSCFVVNKRGKVYLLEVQSTPNLKPDSSFAHVCESVGAKMHDVVEHMLEGA